MIEQKSLAARRDAMSSVRGLVERYEAKLEKLLPSVVSPKRMIETVLTEIARQPKLLECTQSSLIGSMIQAGQLGLVPGLQGECWLLPFRNGRAGTTEAQLIVGYRGLLKLAYNSGEVASVQATVVRKGDDFAYQYGTEGYLHHKPDDDLTDDRPMTHAYAVVWLRNSNRPVWEVLNRAKVMKAKASSPSVRAGQHSAWDTHEDEMWAKTALRHVCKRLPASIERLAIAVSLDERADANITQGLGAFAPELPDTPASGAFLIDVPPSDDGAGGQHDRDRNHGEETEQDRQAPGA